MAFPFKSEGFWGPLFRRRDRARTAVETPRAPRPSKRQLVLRLKAKADRLFNRDRLIFDPLEPRVLLDASAAYQINVPLDQQTAEHKVLVELIEMNQAATTDAAKVQQVQVFAYSSSGGKGAQLHTFGDISASNSNFTIEGTSQKDRIVVDVASFERLTGSTKPILSFSDPANDGVPTDSGDTIELLNRAKSGDTLGATFTLDSRNTGKITAGNFEGNFAGIGNLVGAAGADDTLIAGSAGGILDGAFGGGKHGLQIDFSAVSSSIDATLKRSDSDPGRYLLQRSSQANGAAATFAAVAFTAPSTNLGVLLGTGSDTLRFETLPPGPSFTVSGGAGADTIVFDTALQVATGNIDLTFDGGDGDDTINLNKNLEAVAGSLAVTFRGGAGDNSLTVGDAAQIRARDGVVFTAGATVAPVLTTTGSASEVTSTAKMGVVVNQNAVIGGASVAIQVTGSTTIANGDTNAGAAKLSVDATTAATISLAGRIETAGEAALTTSVVNSATLTSTRASQLREVSVKQKNTSTVTVGAQGAVNGGTVKLAADTQANVVIKAIGLVLPGAETITDAAKLTAETMSAILKGEADLGAVLTSTEGNQNDSIAELAVKGFIKKAKTSIDNETRVSVAATGQVRQTGAGTVAGSDAAVLMAATDETNVRTRLVATDGVKVPAIGRTLDLPGMLNPFALSAEQTVKRVTAVDLGLAADATLPATAPDAAAAKIVDAAGAVALQAGNSGVITTRIRAATEAPDPNNATKQIAGDGGDGLDGEPDDGSLPAPIKTGYADTTVDDTVRVAVRGVSLAAASLRAAAGNDTSVESRAIQAQNALKGSTTATAAASRLLARTGSVSVTAIDTATASAIAEPVDTDTLRDTTTAGMTPEQLAAQAAQEKKEREFLGLGRGSAINLAERDVTAALTASETSAATDVTLIAQNALELTAEAQATGVASILGAAGTIAVNIVLGSTGATVSGGSVKAATGDVVISAADISTVDARARTTVDSASRDGQLVVTVPAIGAAAAFNIVGYKLDGMGSSSIIPKILSASVDTILGTGLLTATATQTIRARIEGAKVEAGGRVQVTAASAGTVNATVSNTIANKTPEQTLADDIKADVKRRVLNNVKKPSAATQNNVATAGTASIGGIISTNRIARAASAEIVALTTPGGTTAADVTGTGALDVFASDRATINANVKLVASSQAASDGGLDPNLKRTAFDFKASKSGEVELKLGKRVVLDFPGALNSAPRLERVKGALPVPAKDAIAGRLPAPSPTMQSIAPGVLVLVSPGHPAGKGEPNTYYFYKPNTASAPMDLAGADFTDTATWQKIGEKGAVYAWMGTDGFKTTLKDQPYGERDYWRRVGDGETQPSKTTGSGATSAGGIVSRNDIRGGATAIISGNAKVKAGSVAVSAERSAVITAKADATVEAVATIREQQGRTADDKPGTGTPSPVPGRTSIFDRSGTGTNGTQTSASNALAVNAVIATNAILSAATARIADSTVETTGTDGAVSVSAKTGGSITSKVDAQVTALSSGPANTGDGSAATGGTTTGTAEPPTTSARAAGIQLAFNAIGFELGNLGFATLDALVGTNLGSPATQQAVAEIANSTVTATGAVSATAVSGGEIDATLGNKVTASARAASADALAVSGIVAMNRVSGAARAAIDAPLKTVSGTDVTVTATDSVKIASTTTVGASAKAVSTGSVSGVDKSADALLNEYTYTTKSGPRKLAFGDKIRLSDTWSGKGEKGAVYQYMGQDFTGNVDLGLLTGSPGSDGKFPPADSRLDFSDFALWKKLDATNVVPGGTSGSQPRVGKVSSTGFGGIFSRNDVSGRAEASIVAASLAARGDVTVAAKSTGAIKATDTSVISGGTAVNGVLVSNTVLNGATAFIKDTLLDGGGLDGAGQRTGTGGAVTVTATNTSDIDASAKGKTAGEAGTALGFTLAFNTVGFAQQNPLFNAVDTIVGDPLIATATGAEKSAGATAFITGSRPIKAGRDVTVAADSSAQIKAMAGSEVSQADTASTVYKAETGAQGISAGAVLASNKVSARAVAYIGAEEETAQPSGQPASVTSTGGSVVVTATNRSGIDASSTTISSSAVSGSVAELAKKAVATAQNIYDYSTKSGERTLKTGDRVRLGNDYTGAAGPKGEDPAVKGQVYIYIGASAKLDLGAGTTNFADSTKWFAVSEGATVTTKPATAASTPSTDTTTESKSVTSTDGKTTTTVTRLKARYTTNDFNPSLRTGETVLFKTNNKGAKGTVGTIYIYRGPDNTEVNLQTEDYTSDNWIPAAAKAVMPAIDKVSDVTTPAKTTNGTVTPPSTARTPASSSKSIGGLIVFNEVNGGATARVTDATVKAGADLTVSAKDAANIAATLITTVTASGGASFASKPPAGTTAGTAPGDGSVIAANGLAATNVVRGGAAASVLRSTVEATRGDLTVKAENTAGIDARLRASSATSGGGQGGVSAAVTLAFNSVGYETQNLLFNTIDALIGSPTISDAFGNETGSGATATIVQSGATAGGDITVAAVSSTKINSTISNAATSSTDSMKGSGGTGFGVVLASNKVSGRATATIDNTADTSRTVAAGDAVTVSATDSNTIASNAQLVTSSTVVKTDGGTLTNQAKLNKFLPSDFSTNPNEVQSATIQSNLIKNRADLLPAEINKLEAEMWAEVARVKQAILDAQAEPQRFAQLFDNAQLTLKSRPAASDYLKSVYTTLADAMKAAIDLVPANNRTDLKKNLTDAERALRQETLGNVLDNSVADAARDTAYKYAAEAALLGLIDDAALRASPIEARQTVGDMIGRQVTILRANREAVAQIEALRNTLNTYLAPFGLSTDMIATLDLTAFGQVKKTANLQDVTFGARVRIADDYAAGANKAPYKTTDGKEISVKTGDTVWDNGNNSIPGGAVYKYVGEATLLKQQPSAIRFDSQTAGKPDWVKISSKPSVYAANEIYIYMGEAAKIDLAAQDYSDKTLWKRALDSNFIPDGFVIPGTTTTPTQPAPASTDPTTPLPVGDPSKNNPQPTATPQNAAALAIGGLVVVNSVHGGAAASITKAAVTTGTGAVTVAAQETATITATADSAATVKSADSYKKTAPASTGTGTTPPGTGTPGAGTQTQTKSLALGGIIATNSVLGAADAKIVDSTVTTGAGGVSVTASNTATIDATNKTTATSDVAAVALTLAFNTVGWKDQNVLFRAADTITGQPLIAEAFHNDDTPSGASAQILRTAVTTAATGAVTVAATADAGINAVVSNKSSASGNVLKDASAYALGFVLTGNMVNTRALATIDNTGSGKSVEAGGALTIQADSAGSITSANRLSALASLTKPSVLQDFAEKILANYDYTKKSGEKNLKFGDLVYNKENGDDKVYVYIGASQPVQLKDADFTDATKWRLNNAREFIKFLPPGVLNLADSKDASPSSTKPAEGSTSASDTAAPKPYAVAVSGILVSNDVRSTAEATLRNTSVTRAGDVTVAATQTGTIEASVTSKVESKLKPGTKPGTKGAVAVGAVIAANVVTGSSTATVIGSKLGDAGAGRTVGNVTVEAANAGTITATVSSIVESSETAVGVTAAFNKIGTSSQNVLFDLSDAIVGTDLGTTIQGANTFAATASISGQPINATGLVKVSAKSNATITSEIKNAVTTVGATVTSVGAVVGLNFARLATSATLSGMDSVKAAGVSVSALSTSKIDADVTAPVTSVAYRMQSPDPNAQGSSGGGQTGGQTGTQTGHTVSVALSIARNTIVEETLLAAIDEVGEVTASAGDVRVLATSGAAINAKATATAIAVLLSTEDGKNIGFAGGGALGFNTILGGAQARISSTRAATVNANGNVAPGADGTGGQGNITVSAVSASSIEASVQAAAAAVVIGKGESQAVAIGVTLAFNMIGFYGSGLPTGTNFKEGTTRSFDVRAGVTGTRLTAGRRVLVEASSQASITAKTLAAAVAVGASTGGSQQSSGSNVAGTGGGLYVGNKIVTTTTAVIDGSTGTNDAVKAGTGGISVSAADTSTIRATSVALAVSANLSGKSSSSGTQPSVAIGAALANNEIGSDVTARIVQVADLATPGAVTLSASRSATIFAQTFAASIEAAVSGQGKGFGVSGGGALSLNTVGGSTVAELTGSTVGNGTDAASRVGSLDVLATDTARIAALTGALAIAANGSAEGKASGVAVGASVSNNVISAGAAVRATISGTPVRSTGAVRAAATSSQTIDATTIAVSVGVSASGSDQAVAVSLGGSVARNVIDIATTAQILGAVAIEAGSVAVRADNSSAVSANVGAASIAAAFGSTTAVSVALAASVALNTISGNVSAGITDATVTTLAGGVTVAATRTGTIGTKAAAASVAVGIGGEKGIGVAGAGVAAVNRINSSTTAEAANAKIDAQGAVAVSASSTATITADILSAAVSVGGGSDSAGAGALGLAIAYNEIGGWTAYDEAKHSVSETPSLNGRAKVSAALTDTTVKATGALSVEATSGNTITANIAAIAAGVSASGDKAGAVTIGGTFAMNSIGLATLATIDGDGIGATPGIQAASAKVSAQDVSAVTVQALSASLALAAAANNAVSISVGGSIALNTIANDVSASVKGVDRGLQTVDAILVSAKSAGSITARAASAAIAVAGSGSNAVPISAAVTYARNVITTSTRAQAGESRLVTTGANGTVSVTAEASATIDAAILAASLAAGVGGSNAVAVGIGAAIAENRIGLWSKSGSDSNTSYTLANNGGTVVEASLTRVGVDAKGALSVEATSKNQIKAAIAALSAGLAGGGSNAVGVSGGATAVVNAIGVTTQAFIEGNGVANSAIASNAIKAGAVSVKAADTSSIVAHALTAAVSAAFGGSAGVSVSIGFALALNTIDAATKAGVSNVSGGIDAGAGAVLVDARSNATITATTTAAAVSIGGGGSAGVAVAGGGALAFNSIRPVTRAAVTASPISQSGSITVTAAANSTISALVAAASLAVGAGGSAGVGVAIGVSVAANRIGDWTSSGEGRDRVDTAAANQTSVVEAVLSGGSAKSSGALTVGATSAQSISAQVAAAAASIGGGGAAGVGVSAAGVTVTNAIAVATRAVIDGDGAAGIEAGSVSVSAADSSTIEAFAGSASLAGSGGGSAGVSVAVGFTLALNSIAGDVEAKIVNADTLLRTTGAAGAAVSASRAGRIYAAAAAAA
ncbi:LEPR-XLL domain-containing protein, partial [Methylorubrum podarium]|uniref:LEPR-XLL domain-containing protein n=1 Tax=Methylorubrum podarium TaxID=200476 RepID=UPI001EE2B433